MIIRLGRLSCLVLTVFALLTYVTPAHAATFTVTNGTDVGFGTLRERIQLANSSPGKDTIDFQIPPTGSAATIQPTNYLPLITDPVVIDGWSQLGDAICQAGIEIDGSLAGSGNGLSLWVTTNCIIKGICINRFDGNGILINQGGDHRIFGCFIGTDIAGTTDLGNTGDGIVIISSIGNFIGQLPTYSCTNRNIISGNGRNGVELLGTLGPCSGNALQNNHIGVDFNGNAQIANDWNGVCVQTNVSANNIGSTAVPKPVNVISGNRTNGVYIYLGSGNSVLGNHIGVTRLSDAALANGLNGVVITNATGTYVGDNSGEARNVIAGNGDDGVDVSGGGTSGNNIMGNYIGIASNGLGAIPNGGHGVLLTSDCTQNRVGDDTTVLGRNVISGNDECGVKIGERAYGNWVYNNYIGLSRDGLLAVTNRNHGVLIENAAFNNFVGNSAAGYTNSGNVISGNGFTNTYHGVCIQSSAYGNEVARNRIGLNANNFPVPNKGDGIRVQNSDGNTIGGTNADDRNFISGNGGSGIQLGTNATGNIVLGNFIGLDTNGVVAIPNSKEGVLIYRSSQNQIGTIAGGSRNVISGNAGSGVMISDNASARNNTIQNNYIGTTVSGLGKIGNSDNGVLVSGAISNQVGTTTAGNLISGNDFDGVRLDTAAAYNQVYQNLIGVDGSGAAPLGNGRYGIYISGSSRNAIGTSGGYGNTISGNGNDGIHITSVNSVSNTVQANSIGVDATWLVAISNAGNGVWIGASASGNLIGGPSVSYRNKIACNGDCGVRITSGTNNAILYNSFGSNRNYGIDLGTSAGLTPNDVQDPDVGANFLQNYPVLYEATTGSVTISGTLNSRPLTTYWLEFFRARYTDTSGYGEGDDLIGATNVTTDASGNADFECTFAYSLPTGRYITATATDPYGNTSEFAKNVQTVPNELYGDADHDGMPTRWEGPNHLDPNDATGTNGAAGDPDGDGSDNFDEYVADTAPSDPSNYFRVVNIQQTNNILVTYTSTNTRYYVAAGTTNLMDGSAWINVYPYSVAGSNGLTTADQAAATTRLYRVAVQLVP